MRQKVCFIFGIDCGNQSNQCLQLYLTHSSASILALQLQLYLNSKYATNCNLEKNDSLSLTQTDCCLSNGILTKLSAFTDSLQALNFSFLLVNTDNTEHFLFPTDLEKLRVGLEYLVSVNIYLDVILHTVVSESEKKAKRKRSSIVCKLSFFFFLSTFKKCT